MSAYSLVELSDDELGEVAGQASLLSIDKYNYGANNFYRVQANSIVTTSVNIDNLELKDSGGNTQIGVENFSLNGGIDNQVSSAVLTNPYVEFAFAGDMDSTDARSREILGIRVGAEEIDGMLSFGDRAKHGTATENGLSQFRGYMQTLPFAGEVRLPGPGAGQDVRTVIVNTTLTASLVGSLDADGSAQIPLLDNGQQIVLDFTNSTGVVLDSSQTTPGTAGGDGYNNNGVFTTAYVTADVAPTTVTQMQSISSSVDISGGSCGWNPICLAAAALLGEINPVITVTNTGLSGPGASTTDPIPMFLNEGIKYFHKVEANSSGFFISAQNQDVTWKNLSPTGTGRLDSPTTAGWWMEFLDPVDVGSLAIEDYYLPDNVVAAIGTDVNAYINNQPTLSVGDALAALQEIDVDGVHVNLAANQSATLVGAPASLGSFAVVDQNISINSQTPIRNCWNGSSSC
jgi:hypothetical protein